MGAARRLLDSSEIGTAALRAACAGRPEDLHGPAITDLARRGDPAARALLAELGDWLSVGLAALTAVLDPECFVIGGGVADAGEELLGPVRDGLRRRLPAGRARPGAEVVAAHLGNDAGMIGAADLARIGVGRT